MSSKFKAAEATMWIEKRAAEILEAMGERAERLGVTLAEESARKQAIQEFLQLKLGEGVRVSLRHAKRAIQVYVQREER